MVIIISYNNGYSIVFSSDGRTMQGITSLNPNFIDNRNIQPYNTYLKHYGGATQQSLSYKISRKELWKKYVSLCLYKSYSRFS